MSLWRSIAQPYAAIVPCRRYLVMPKAHLRVNARAGLLRSADGGLLFLDEIGELGADEQVLLKAVEEKRFYPVGSDKEVHSDFQLIAGTCRDLAQDVQQGRFREDLFARLNMWTFHLPAERTT